MKSSRKFFAFFDNETSVIAKWIVITEQQKEEYIKNKKSFYFKEVPEPDYLIGQLVFLSTKWWYRKAVVTDIVPIFKSNRFSRFFYSTNIPSDTMGEEELFDTAFRAIINSFKNSFDALFLKLSSFFK